MKINTILKWPPPGEIGLSFSNAFLTGSPVVVIVPVEVSCTVSSADVALTFLVFSGSTVGLFVITTLVMTLVTALVITLVTALVESGVVLFTEAVTAIVGISVRVFLSMIQAPAVEFQT